jgi:hypothetical protein
MASENAGVEVARGRRTRIAVCAIFVTFFLTSCDTSGSSSANASPPAGLRVVVKQFMSALTSRDRTALIDMTASGWGTEDLKETLAHYGGLKTNIVSYESDVPALDYGVQFRASCPNGKIIHFAQGFFSADGSWYPVFGKEKSPPAASDPPAASVPSALLGTPPPRESC